MKRRTVLGFLACLAFAPAAWGRASPEEAQALVRKAVALYVERGRDAALQEISRPGGPFVAGELYVTVHGMDGMCLADIDAANPGRYMWMVRDPDGRRFVQERLQAAKAAASGWQEYKQINPQSGRVQIKRTYWERSGELVFASGYYKSRLATM